MHIGAGKGWLMLPAAALLLATTVLGCAPAAVPITEAELGGASRLSGTVTEAGSTTLQPVAEKLAAEFKKMHPDANVVVQGGGSSVGVKSAAQGIVDMGAASRELKDSEKGTVQEHLLAKDAIAIVTHPSNKVSGLTKEQVQKIFAGEITRWGQVGGQSKEIHVVAREEGSGTRDAFQEMVMEKDVITKNAILQPSNGAVRTTIVGDGQAIGFLSFGYLDPSVKAVDIGGVAATVENAKAGKYPIVRPLFFLTKGQPHGLVKAFIDFCMSPEGNKIVEKEGYLSPE
ncbi:MAG: phosphate ABC transporter substrate-binding protein [Chloroflexota bacterium]